MGHVTIKNQPVTVYVVEGSLQGAAPIPYLTAVPPILSFLAQPGDAPRNATIGVWPSGSHRIPFTAMSEAPWLTVSSSAGSAPAILTLVASPSGLQQGTYSTHIDITSTQAANGGARIPVTLTVENSVVFNVDPASIATYSPTAPVEMTLTSTQTMTFTASGLEQLPLCQSGGAGTTPGQISILGGCSPNQSAWGNIEFATSANNVREVPVAFLPPALYPLINPGGIVNDATFAPGPVAPGSIAAIFGTELSSSTASCSAPLPLSCVLFGPTLGLFAAPNFAYFGNFYQSPGQWNIQIPFELTPGTYMLQIGTSPWVNFTVVPVAPYVFNWGNNHGSILNADNSLNTPDRPAAAGSFMQVYLTGQGAVNPSVPSTFAAPSSPLSYVAATTTATIDGTPASVSFAGLAPGFVGLCQVNIDIPTGLPPGQHSMVIAIGGVQSNQVVFNTK